MAIELTEQQHEQLTASDESPLRVVDPQTRRAYVLIPAEEYESLLEVIEDERQQRGIRSIALRNAGRRMDAEP